MSENKKIERRSLANVKNINHAIFFMSEGNKSVGEFLDNIGYFYNMADLLDNLDLVLDNVEGGFTCDFDKLSDCYEMLKESLPEIRRDLESINDLGTGSKLQIATILALDKMNMRGLQIDFAFRKYSKSNFTDFLESLADPILQKRMLLAVNVNSAKHSFDELAVENRFAYQNVHPKLTAKQMEWFKNLPSTTFIPRDDVEKIQQKLENENKHLKINTNGFRLIR